MYFRDVNDLLLKDMTLINLVDSEGFCELMKYDEPGYRIISAGTITSCVLKRYKEKKKDELKEQLLSSGFNY